MTPRPEATPEPHDVKVAVPRRWRMRRDLAPDVIVEARGPALPSTTFPPEITLRAEPTDQALSQWRADALAALARQLEAFEPEDDDTFDLAGGTTDYRRFSHRVRGIEVVCEQWAWRTDDGLGIVLTASVARADYLAYCDLFEEVAATIEIGDGLTAA